MHVLLGLSFCGSAASFINLQKRGYKLFAFYMEPSHLDAKYEEDFSTLDLELLKLTSGKKGSMFECLRTVGTDLSFSSSNVRGGGMFQYVDCLH